MVEVPGEVWHGANQDEILERGEKKGYPFNSAAKYKKMGIKW